MANEEMQHNKQKREQAYQNIMFLRAEAVSYRKQAALYENQARYFMQVSQEKKEERGQASDHAALLIDKAEYYHAEAAIFEDQARYLTQEIQSKFESQHQHDKYDPQNKPVYRIKFPYPPETSLSRNRPLSFTNTRGDAGAWYRQRQAQLFLEGTTFTELHALHHIRCSGLSR